MGSVTLACAVRVVAVPGVRLVCFCEWIYGCASFARMVRTAAIALLISPQPRLLRPPVMWVDAPGLGDHDLYGVHEGRGCLPTGPGAHRIALARNITSYLGERKILAPRWCS